MNDEKSESGNSMNYSTYRRICFTIFGIEKDNAVEILKNWKSIKYCIVGEEICPSTQKIHLQCYAEFNSPVRISTIKNKFKKLNNCHFESSRGDSKSNYEYCSKDKNFTEWGTRLPDDYKGQGSREDLRSIAAEILDGNVSVDEIAENRPMLYHQYGRTLHKIEDIKLRKVFRTWMTECDWIYGPTGVGKSHTAFENFDPSTHYVWKLNDGKWQDDYTGQEIVIINDFRGQIPYDELLQMIDKWPYTIARRGRSPAPFLAKKIIITCPMSPQEVYHNRNANDSIEQLLRRVKLIHLENAILLTK